MWGSKELRSKSLNTVWKADASTLGLRGRFFALWFCRSSMFARSCLQKDKIGQDYQTKVTLGSSKWHFCVCGGPLLGCSLQKKSALGWRPWALLKILGGIGALSVRRFSNFQVQRNALIWQKQKQRKSRKISMKSLLLAALVNGYSTYHRNSEVLPLTEKQKIAIVRAHNVYRNAVSPKGTVLL